MTTTASAAPRIAALLLAALLTSCASGPRISANQDPTVDLGSYRTYGFASPLATDRPGGATSLVSTYLTQATQREMNALGYRQVEAAPDLVINFYLNTQEKIQARTSPAPGAYYGYRRGYYGVWGGYGTETTVTQYTEGTLHVDLVDARRNQRVWEGVAEGRIPSDIRETLPERACNVISEIFARYPIPTPAAN